MIVAVDHEVWKFKDSLDDTSVQCKEYFKFICAAARLSEVVVITAQHQTVRFALTDISEVAPIGTCTVP